MKLSFVSDSLVESCNFSNSSSNSSAFFAPCLKGTRCPKMPKDYDSPRGLCTGQIDDFNFRELLVYSEFKLSSLSAMFFFYLPRCWASRKPITSIEFKFVATQVVASVVIRTEKLKFVAECRTRVYFAQHIASSCNTVFCCETSSSKTWLYAQQCVSTCNSAMLGDKLKKNVAGITGQQISRWYISRFSKQFSLKNFDTDIILQMQT